MCFGHPTDHFLMLRQFFLQPVHPSVHVFFFILLSLCFYARRVDNTIDLPRRGWCHSMPRTTPPTLFAQPWCFLSREETSTVMGRGKLDLHVVLTVNLRAYVTTQKLQVDPKFWKWGISLYCYKWKFQISSVMVSLHCNGKKVLHEKSSKNLQTLLNWQKTSTWKSKI